MHNIDKFPQEVSTKLNHYVYRLIDPRNGETFYVGEGKGNRVFDHVNEVIKFDKDTDALSAKYTRIREIKNAGLEVIHVIHRHGMDLETAYAVEAALIDAYPGLANKVGGHGSNDFGPMHAQEIMQMYKAEEANFDDCRALLIKINQSATESNLYDATRFAWKLSERRAQKAQVVLAAQNGIILEVFEVVKWLDATQDNFPGFPVASEDRIGFMGNVAGPEMRQKFFGKRVPEKYRSRGASNPVRYINI